MDDINRLILENQQCIINALSLVVSRKKMKDLLEEQFDKTKEALSPRSGNIGWEKDLEEKQ